MQRKTSWLFLCFFILAIFLRKNGFGMSGLLLNVSALLLCVTILLRPVLFKNLLPRIFLSLFLIACIALLQYKIQNSTLEAVVLSAWLIFSAFTFHTVRKNTFGLFTWTTVSFILLTAVIFNPRKFHNFYRASTYEEHIRLKFSEERGIVADYFIDLHKNPDKIKAGQLLRYALLADSLKENERALYYYNKSIDLYPDNAFAYYKRGYLKLNRLDLNNDMAISAIKDFSRAIRINPLFTEAYFQRGLAFGYLGNKGRSLVDRKIVWKADSSLANDVFYKKYGSSKESFFIPFHP